jgi:hypothetical protein
VNWRIYYADESEYSNQDGDPENAPGGGALAIVLSSDGVGYQIIHGAGFYWWQKAEQRWFNGDVHGLDQYYLDEQGWQKVILGKSVTNKDWTALMMRIEKDWGPKSSYWPGERR